MPGDFVNPLYEESWIDATGTGSISNPAQLYQSILDEQKALNKLQMEREDSSYQRMVADMKKAGLNPWTGVSTGGLSSSSQVNTQKSALDSFLNILGYNVNNTSNTNKQGMAAFKLGASLVFPLLAFLG